jgi:hypothetical protein
MPIRRIEPAGARFVGALAVAVLVLGFLSLAGCAQPGRGGVAAPAPGPTSPLWISCPSPRPNPTSTLDEIYRVSATLGELADRLRPVAERFPDVYSGLAVEAECDRLVVYRRPSAAFDAAVRAALPGAPVVIRDAKHTERELAALTQQITDDLAYWRARGVEVVSVGGDPTTGVIHIGTKDVERVKKEFPVRYGTGLSFEVELQTGVIW